MGRIYDQLKQNVDFLNEIDRRLRNNERLNMHEIWEVQKAIVNVNYVINYADSSFENGVGEERFEIGENKSFNVPDNLEQIVDEWEDQFGEEQVDNVVEQLKTNQRVPSYSPELNEPDPIRYFNHVTGTLDNIVTTVTTGKFGPTQEAFTSLVSSARQDYIDTAIEQNFVMDPNAPRIKQDVYPWLAGPHVRYMGDVGAENPESYIVRAQRDINNYEAEQGIDNYEKRFKNNLAAAKVISKVENATLNEHALADAIKIGVGDYANKNRSKDEPTIGELLSKTRDKLEEKVLFGELDLYEENEDAEFLRDYLIDPVEAMAKHYDKQAASQGNNGAESSRRSARKVRAERNNYDQANRGKNNGWEVFENNRRDAFEMNIREHYPDFNPAKLADEYKGGFMERKILRSTSQEWKNVTTAFASWNRNGPDKGNLAKVTYPAMAYLRHKFPHTRVEDITPEMARSLRGAGAQRALFCLSVVDSARNAQQDAIEGQRELNEAKIREFEQRAGIVHEEAANNNINNNDIQNDFRESLKNDIEPKNNEINEAPKANNEERHNENDIVIGEDE